jgi:hypothetical protein
MENKKFNPSLGGAFENDKFGEGSVFLQITKEGYDALMQNLQVGGGILFRFNRVTQKGNKHYFAEVLPPWEPKEKTEGGKPTSDLD